MMKKFIAGLLLLATLFTVVACADDQPETPENTTTNGGPVNTAPIVTDDEYDYPDIDLGKDKFVFLNVDEGRWDMNTALIADSAEGTELNSAIFKRNSFIEQKYDIEIAVINKDIYTTCDFVTNQVMANGGESDENVDAAYCYGEYIGPLVSQGILADLSQISTLQLEKPWWNQNVRESTSIGSNDSIFYALSDLSLTSFDLTWSIMFNATIANEIQLPNLYEAVAEHKWTLGLLKEYAEAGMNLNGETSYEFVSGGKARYGLTSYDNFLLGAMHGSGCFMTVKNSEGNPEFALGDQHFYDFAEKFASLVTDGNLLSHNDSSAGITDAHYEGLFTSGRVLFVGAEMKATKSFKQKGVEYGLLPIPKFDEKQEEYYSNLNYLVPLLGIPTNNLKLEETGAILDALSYHSYNDVLPVYYDITLSIKNLNDEESIAMLDIIRDGRTFEASLCYGWTNDVYALLKRTIIQAGRGEVSSVVSPSAAGRVNAKIDEMLFQVG